MRLIDLHCNWLWQYARETTCFDPLHYAAIGARLGQLDGYLLGTDAAVLACGRVGADWALQPDPWMSLADLLARYEAEFCGRLLRGPEDVKRWLAEPGDGLCWGTLGVAGFDFLVRESAHLDRLPVLFERGIRVFQLVSGGSNLLAGSADAGDDRGLTDLGRSFLQVLAELGASHPDRVGVSREGEPASHGARTEPRPPNTTHARSGPMPIVDLAGLNRASMRDVVDWAQTNAVQPARVLLAYTHGATNRHGIDSPRAITWDHVIALRSLGGVIGLTPSRACYESADQFRGDIEAVAGIPYEGCPGFKGMAIGADFLGPDEPLSETKDVARLIRWVTKHFDQSAAVSLIAENGRRLLVRAAGVDFD
jgi:membrane dipeptidase